MTTTNEILTTNVDLRCCAPSNIGSMGATTVVDRAASRFEQWQKIATAIAAAIGVIWAGIRFLYPIGPTDLTVQISDEVAIGLPSSVDPLPLVLEFQGRKIQRAVAFRAKLLNTGTTPIGQVGKAWTIELRNRSNLTVIPVGTVLRSPANVAAKIIPTTKENVVSLELELFNPGDSIQLALMLLDPPNDYRELPVFGEARVSGLSEPITTRQEVRERIRDSFFAYLAVPLLILASALIVYERFWPAKNLYRPTARALSAMKKEGVPDAVLEKLAGDENRGFSEEGYQSELRQRLGSEYSQYQKSILKHAHIGGSVFLIAPFMLFAALTLAMFIANALAWIAFGVLSK